jgi:hypothetical protein
MMDKPTYASEDIPDVEEPNNLDLLNRRDTRRNQILLTFLAARNKEIQARTAITSHVPMDVFGEVDGSSLLPGYQRLLEVLVIYAKQKLGAGGFLDLLLADEKDFLATAKAAIFLLTRVGTRSCTAWEETTKMKFNEACSAILSRLFRIRMEPQHLIGSTFSLLTTTDCIQ